MVWDQESLFIALLLDEELWDISAGYTRVSSAGYWSLREVLVGAGDGPDSRWWRVRPTIPTKGLCRQLRKPSQKAQRLWEGLDVLWAPGRGLVGRGRLSPTFRVERCFGSRGEGGVGSAERRGRSGPDWSPALYAARSGAEPQPEQSEQLEQFQPGRARKSATTGLFSPILSAVGGEGDWGSSGCHLCFQARSAIAPVLSGHGLSTKYGGRGQYLHSDGLTVWGPKRKKTKRTPCKSIASLGRGGE